MKFIKLFLPLSIPFLLNACTQTSILKTMPSSFDTSIIQNKLDSNDKILYGNESKLG